MRFQTRKLLFSLAIFSAMPLLVACPKKDPPPVDAAPPPPPPDPDTGTATLIPLEDDAGDAGSEDSGKKLAIGPGGNTNVIRLKQCCAAIRKQAQGAPELIAAATTCDGLAAQAGPNGNAPELGALRGLFGGRTIPPVCAGF